jgi:hypothetical protein
MPIIASHLGSQIGAFFSNRCYWAVKLTNDKWLCELDTIPDLRTGTQRELDWTLDIVGSGDIGRIRELWMFCPKSLTSPLGNTATLRFTEPRTAFVLKRGSVSMFHRTMDYLIIGKVLDKYTGDCECFIWDDRLRGMSAPYYTNVSNFAAWRAGVLPIGRLSYEVLGLDIKYEPSST